jgi:ubiquinone/menaquinone biosynthesis C-methylase UbiE
VYVVDPAVVGRRLARKRLDSSPVPVEFVGLDGESIPLAEQSVDAVLSTWTLCSIPGISEALSELRRVLRPGGTLHFLEHGRHDDEAVVRWQDRLNPVHRFVAGGCHLNRKMDELIESSGFEMVSLETYQMAGPSTMSFMYEGVARKVE